MRTFSVLLIFGLVGVCLGAEFLFGRKNPTKDWQRASDLRLTFVSPPGCHRAWLRESRPARRCRLALQATVLWAMDAGRSRRPTVAHLLANDLRQPLSLDA